MRSKCQAAVSKGGTLTLPAKKLYEIVKALPETEVRIEEDKNGVKVAADRFDSRMQTQPPQDFPAVPEASGSGSATLPASAIRAMVSKTQFAITGEDTRFFLNGALFILGPESMSLVATDGHRLAHVTVVRAKGSGKGPKTKCVPFCRARRCGNSASFWPKGTATFDIERGENHLFFQVGDRMLISRMIDGQFPAFERVIPKGNNRRIEFERERLTNAVRRVALLSNERSRAVKFYVENGKVEVTSSSPEFGEAHEVIPVEYTEGAMQICFNAQYVLDFLNVVETDQVVLELKDETSQAVMKPLGAEGYDYTYVIMPMRV